MLTEKNINIVRELKLQLLRNFSDTVNSVILFGSRAKGIADENSDYDILVVLKNDYDWKYEKEISKVFYRFEVEKEIFTDFHLISLNQINNSIKGKDPLFFNALKNGIYI